MFVQVDVWEKETTQSSQSFAQNLEEKIKRFEADRQDLQKERQTIDRLKKEIEDITTNSFGVKRWLQIKVNELVKEYQN